MRIDADRNKDGSLSQYALRCGKVQQSWLGNTKVELYQEHGCYHIRAYNHTLNDCRLVWESTWSLTYARKQYDALLKLLGHTR